MWETVVRTVGDLDSVLGFEVRVSPLSDPIYSIHTHRGSMGVDDKRARSGIY
jgi:hypothetical protein